MKSASLKTLWVADLIQTRRKLAVHVLKLIRENVVAESPLVFYQCRAYLVTVSVSINNVYLPSVCF